MQPQMCYFITWQARMQAARMHVHTYLCAPTTRLSFLVVLSPPPTAMCFLLPLMMLLLLVLLHTRWACKCHDDEQWISRQCALGWKARWFFFCVVVVVVDVWCFMKTDRFLRSNLLNNSQQLKRRHIVTAYQQLLLFASSGVLSSPPTHIINFMTIH